MVSYIMRKKNEERFCILIGCSFAWIRTSCDSQNVTQLSTSDTSVLSFTHVDLSHSEYIHSTSTKGNNLRHSIDVVNT